MSLAAKRALLFAAFLVPMAALGSFGGGAPCKDFSCHFLMWGGLLGVAGGIPTSGLVFILLHLAFRNPERSKISQVFVGGLIGIVAFVISAACASLMATWGKSSIGHHENYPVMGFASAYVVLAVLSALYARSSPRP